MKEVDRQMISNKTIIGTMSHFLPNEMCDSLIEKAREKLFTMETLGGQNNGRIADGCWLSNEEPEVRFIKEAIAQVSKYPIQNQEDLHIVRYGVGGRYDPHWDYFIEGESYYDEVMSRGGQRSESWLIYLNDNFEGGETEFPREGIKIEPQKGLLVAWRNLLEDGNVNPNSFHGGLPVLSGEKWIGVIWVTEGRFR